MTALIIVTAESAQAFIVDSLPECVLAAQYFLPFARAFCWPAGVTL